MELDERNMLPMTASSKLVELVQAQRDAKQQWMNALSSWLAGTMDAEVYESYRIKYLRAIDKAREQYEKEYDIDGWIY